MIGYTRDTYKLYIHIGNGVNIGADSTFFATRVHRFINDMSFAMSNLTIMTGDHPFDVKGFYGADNIVRNGKYTSKYDNDLVIEDDVWMAAMLLYSKGFI